MEWWYFIGHLKPTSDPAHPGYTIGFIVLRADVVVVHGAVGLVLFVDHETGVRPALESNQIFRRVFERYPRGGFRFDFASGSQRRWSVEASRDLHYKLQLQEGPLYAIDLDVYSGAAFLLGEDGIVDYHQGVELAYYARPHLPTVGRIRISDGSSISVAGHMWLERQWGDADYTAARWKYLLVHPSSAEQWIFFRLDHLKAPRLRKRYACRMAGGQIEQLPESWIQIEDSGSDPKLPVLTRIRVPQRDTDLSVTPLFGLKQYYEPLLAPSFFEGASRIRGTLDGRPVDCWGMTEMANYGGTT